MALVEWCVLRDAGMVTRGSGSEFRVRGGVL